MISDKCPCGHWETAHNNKVSWEIPLDLGNLNRVFEYTNCKRCTCKKFSEDNLEWLLKNKGKR